MGFWEDGGLRNNNHGDRCLDIDRHLNKEEKENKRSNSAVDMKSVTKARDESGINF